MYRSDDLHGNLPAYRVLMGRSWAASSCYRDLFYCGYYMILLKLHGADALEWSAMPMFAGAYYLQMRSDSNINITCLPNIDSSTDTTYKSLF